MQQLLIQNGQVIVANVPTPVVEAGHILVEVFYSLVSTGTEITTVASSGKSLLQRAVEQPEKVKQVFHNVRQVGVRKTFLKVSNKLSEANPTGYSCAGVVLEVGEGVQDIQVGDQVACAGAGLANHAEVVLIPRNLLVKIPAGCDLRQAASVTLGAIAMQGVRRAEPRLGDIVAVIGLGLLGQITVQLLKANGCRVIGVDLDKRRVDISRQLGADVSFSPLQSNFPAEIKQVTDNQGVDTTIITAASSSDAIVQQAMEITRKKGRVVVVGAVGMNLKRSPFYEKEIDFLISCSYGPGRYDELYERKGLDYPYGYVRWTENRNMAEYLRLVADGHIQLDTILEREIALADAPQAYSLLQNSPEKPLGVLLSYPANEMPTASPSPVSTKVRLRTSKLKNGKIGVAVIGAGNFARAMHLPNLKALDNLCQLVAIADVNGVAAKNTASQFGAEYASTSFDDVLGDKNIDLVMICTRHNAHARQTLAALNAGKHVFVEKPLALTSDELAQIEAFFQDTSTSRPLLLTGYNRRFSPFAQRIDEVVSKRHDPMVINYRMNAGYIPLDNWVHTEEGGGRNIGEACHIYDLFTYLTQSKVTEVQAKSIRPKTGYYSSTDNFIATLSFEDGSIATLTYTALGATEYPKEQMEIYVDGTILALDDYKRLTVYGSKEKGYENKLGDKGHLDELRALLNGIAHESWPIPLWQQVQALKIAFDVERKIQ